MYEPFGFRLADEAAVRSARDRCRAAGVVETEWQDDGRFVRVQVADPDGCRVEVYSHYSRHDVEKRRPAPLTR